MKHIIEPVTVWDDATESAKQVWAISEKLNWLEKIVLMYGGISRTFTTKEAAERYLVFIESRR